MQEYRTRSASGQQTIVIALDKDAPPPDFLLAHFEAEMGRGRRFQPEETIQIGWAVITLKQDVAGILAVWEPTFDAMPIIWRRGANHTLRHILLQQSVCRELGCEPQFPSLRQAGIVSPRFLDASEEFRISRDDPSGNDSGWVFSTSGYEGDEGEHRSLFEIALSRPGVIPFLAMPSGAVVTKADGVIEAETDDVQLSSKTNAFMRKLLSARQ